MSNFLKNLWIELSNCDRYKSLATIFCVGVFLFYNGCQIKTSSIVDPTKKITVPELQAEYDSYYAQREADDLKFETIARARAADVNEQITFRHFAYNTALNVATTGGFNWLAILTSAGSIIGAGAVADNIRFRKKVKKTPA